MDVVTFQSRRTGTLLRTHHWLLISPVVSIRKLSPRSYLMQHHTCSACTSFLALAYPIPSHFCLQKASGSLACTSIYSPISVPFLNYLSKPSPSSLATARGLPRSLQGGSQVKPPSFDSTFLLRLRCLYYSSVSSLRLGQACVLPFLSVQQ